MDEALIQKIVEEVIKTLNPTGTDKLLEGSGSPAMLVIGEISQMPREQREEYRLFSMDDYEKYRDIGRYSCVYITRLSLAELSSIALGRDDTPVSCAVVNALLRGMEVCLSGKALWYRKFAGRGSSRLYAVIDGNVRQLESYGVKVIEEPRSELVREVKPPRFCPPPMVVPEGTAKPNTSRLITEHMAIEMAKENRMLVQIPRDAIVTPSAWDVFTGNKIQVERI